MRNRGPGPLFGSRWANRAAGWGANLALGCLFLAFVAVSVQLMLPHPADSRGSAASFKEIHPRIAPIGSSLDAFPVSGSIDWTVETGWAIVRRWRFTATGGLRVEHLPDWEAWASGMGASTYVEAADEAGVILNRRIRLRHQGRIYDVEIDQRGRRFKAVVTQDH